MESGKIEAEPITKANLADIEVLVGKTLRGVSYRFLPEDGEDAEYAGSSNGIDSCLSAVTLTFDQSVSVSVTWAISGEVEGLAVLPSEEYAGVADREVDVSETSAWSSVVGTQISSIQPSWQRSRIDAPESVWSIRIDSDSGSIVIALGEVYPVLDYAADELVVISNPNLARIYWPPHVGTSAWGSE